jgi:DNA-binding NarL/FixJ family response regulator
MNQKIKVITADDHHIFRKGILSILKDDDSIEIVGEASTGIEALHLIHDLNPDIALLDIDMPELSGLDVARKVKNENLKTRIVILTIHKDKEYFNEAIELDIKAYILKDSIANDLIDCIKEVASGNYYISPAISGYLLKNKALHKSNPLDKLTSTELQILKLISQNKTSSQIAKELFRSVRTIENHRNNICKKLNLSGQNALLLYAYENKTHLN